jgi:hypothetical protein
MKVNKRERRERESELGAGLEKKSSEKNPCEEKLPAIIQEEEAQLAARFCC